MENTEELKSEETTTNTEIVEESTTAVDGASEDSDTSNDNVNDAEFTDTKNQEEEPAKSESEQKNAEDDKSKQDNAENARRRREAERQKELKHARYEAIKEAVDGINPFTDEPIEDDIDVEEYLAMKEIKKNGGDPVADYSKYAKDKQKAEEKAKKEKEEQDEWFAKDYADFKEKHPEVNLETLSNDAIFSEFAEPLVGKKPMSEIYDSYQKILEKVKADILEVKARELANEKASPGSLSGQETGEAEFFTMDELKAMSPEFVHKNFEKVNKSLKHWSSKN